MSSIPFSILPLLLALTASMSSAAPSDSAAELKLLELEDIFSPDEERRIDFDGSVPAVEWLDAGTLLVRETEDDKSRYFRESIAGGDRQAFFDQEQLRQALAAIPGVDPKRAEELAFGELRFDPEYGAALLNFSNDLFLYRLGADEVQRLTNDPVAEVGEEWSPDGRFVSFVRGFDLYLLDTRDNSERRLTNGGSSELLFGRLDWVYQEEIYGRGNFKGYWWSADGSSLVLLRLDESPVREFTVVDHMPTELETEVTNYPKAGSPNPVAKLGVVAVAGGDIRWLDTSRYEPIQHLIVSVGWSPDSQKVIFQVQDREQRWLELLSGDPDSGATEVLLRETSPAFVQRLGDPHWLPAGGFVWQSERSGYRHLEVRAADGELQRELTRGNWEVRDFYGVDEAGEWAYFAGMAHDPIAPQIYRVAVAGDAPQRLSRQEGSHSATWSPDHAHFVASRTDFVTPPRLSLHRGDGEQVRWLEENVVAELEQIRWGELERLQVPTRDGFAMEAMLIKPPDFDPSRKYPVLQYNYGGPHAPVVQDRWGGTRYLWHQYLAQRGVVIWMCDNRSASGKGIEPTWKAYRRMGVLELQDIEDGVAWLRQQPWVDAERIGIWGWSYGGFMASYALTHSKSFRMGIAGAPVTDWRLYDTVYTERYMQMPQSNEEGYDETSVVQAAADLHGELLLLHGTMDDNVHLQNSIQLIHELQKADKSFELMIYPKSRHGVRDKQQELHLYRLMSDFIERKLIGGPVSHEIAGETGGQ